MQPNAADYEGLTIREPVMPAAARIGQWWRRRWHFEIRPGSGGSLTLPPPVGDIGDLVMVVTAWWVTQTTFVVETCTRHEALSGDELTYVSIIGAWLRMRFAPAKLVVEGVENHPILRMSELPSETVRQLGEQGY